MGIEPTLFGPCMWKTIHFIALGSPEVFEEKHKAMYRSFYSQIYNVIPCASCGTHLVETMNTLPIEPALTGSQALFQWTVDLHNAVNKRLGKPIVSASDARDMLMGNSGGKSQIGKNKYATIGISFIVALFLMGIVVYALRSKRQRR